MHNDTAYGLLGGGKVQFHKIVDGKRTRIEEKLAVIEIAGNGSNERHGLLPNGAPRPYKGYKGDSNYCIDIVRNDAGKWLGEVVSTFDAYQMVRQHGLARLTNATESVSGKPLVMRLLLDDTVRLEIDGGVRTMRVATLSGNGQVFMANVQEANVDSRNRDKSNAFSYVSKMAGSFQKAKARRVTVSPIGVVNDPGHTG